MLTAPYPGQTIAWKERKVASVQKISVQYRCNLVGRSIKRWSSEKYPSSTFFHLSNTWSSTSLHARTCSYISNSQNCWFILDLYNSCVDLYNLCVAIFMLSYALHAMADQAIAIAVYTLKFLAYEDVLHAFYTNLLGELGPRLTFSSDDKLFSWGHGPSVQIFGGATAPRPPRFLRQCICATAGIRTWKPKVSEWERVAYWEAASWLYSLHEAPNQKRKISNSRKSLGLYNILTIIVHCVFAPWFGFISLISKIDF